MRILLNIIWLVFAGPWLAVACTLAALLMLILIITIPFGVAALRIVTIASGLSDAPWFAARMPA